MKNAKNKAGGKSAVPKPKTKAPPKGAERPDAASKRQSAAPAEAARGRDGVNSGERYAAATESAAAAREKKRAAASLWGFCATCLAALLLLFLLVFGESNMAFFGDRVCPFLQGLVGEWGLRALPAYLVAVLVTWFRDRKNDRAAAKWAFASLNYLTLIMALHFFTADDKVGAQRFGRYMYERGTNHDGAGFIGGNAYLALDRFIGSAAAVTLLVIAFLLTLPALFNSTPLRVLLAVVRGFRTLTVQVSDNADDEEEELTAQVPGEAPRKRRKDSELQPMKEPDKRPAEGERLVYNCANDGLRSPEDGPVPIPRQIEINRTRPARSDGAEDYREVFAGDGEAKGGGAPAAVQEEPDGETEPVKVKKKPLVTGDAPSYVFPPVTLLTQPSADREGVSPEEVRRTSEMLEKTLADFGVGAHVVNTSCGPTITRYELQPDAGIRVRQIANLSDDIALHLAATSVRMECPIPGKSAIGIEIPNKNKNLVRLRELIEDEAFRNSKSKLLCCLGADVVGSPVFLDVEKMPHLLIAGATGMGKSVCINSLIVSLLYRARPDEVKLILIDTKKVEFTDYSGIPHLLVPVVTEPKKAAGALSWATLEMDKRFSEIQDVGARSVQEYNEITAGDPEKEHIPRVVIVIDELADLMLTAPGDVENSICRLAQKARAAGMHLIIGTQRPSVDIITGLIKANIPSRISLKVASQMDSRVILDISGAEKLLNRGDMLYNPVGVLKPVRVQGAYVGGSEVVSVCTYLKQAAKARYSEDVIAMIEKEAQLCGVKPSKRQAADETGEGGADPLELDAIELALECDTLSTSLIQRRLSIGYGRAARIIDRLEQRGIVGEFDPSVKKRKVLITKEEFMQMKMNAADEASAAGAAGGKP